MPIELSRSHLVNRKTKGPKETVLFPLQFDQRETLIFDAITFRRSNEKTVDRGKSFNIVLSLFLKLHQDQCKNVSINFQAFN